MATFMEKFTTLVKGKSHDMLDREINLNSPSMVRQYVRELEAGLAEMRAELASKTGEITTTGRKLSECKSAIDTGKLTITHLQGMSTTTSADAARRKATEVVGLQNEANRLEAHLQQVTNERDKLQQAINDLDAKHTQMVTRVRDLESLDRDSRAKEQSASAIEHAAKLVNMGADVSIDDVTDQMQRRNDQASAKFDQAVGQVKSPEEDLETQNSVDELLNSLKTQK